MTATRTRKNRTTTDVATDTDATSTATADLAETTRADTAPTLMEVDPGTLLVDLNIREAKLDKEFVASIKDQRVIQPIVAVRTDDDQLRVRHGHRRTLAAIEVGLDSVPVLIVGTEDNDAADRITKQWHENKHRAGLTNAQEISAVDQLSLLGLSAATISKRLRSPRRDVDHALAVRTSDLAKAATARYGFLTLEQSATIADFDSDPEAVKILVVAAKDGDVQFARAARAATEARAKATARAELADLLAADGVTVVDRTPAGYRLDHLVANDGDVLTADTHRQCPGHAAYITEEWQQVISEPINPEHSEGSEDDDDPEPDVDDDADWILGPVAVHVCTDPTGYGHPSRYGQRRTNDTGQAEPTAEQKAAASQARRTTLANNKAWREAEPIRRDWLRNLGTRKTAPKGSAAFIAAALLHDSATIRKAMERPSPLVWNLLGIDGREALDAVTAGATDARAQLVTLIVVLAAYEDATHVATWRSHYGSEHRYFGWLAANGYPLAEVETLAAGPQD